VWGPEDIAGHINVDILFTMDRTANRELWPMCSSAFTVYSRAKFIIGGAGRRIVICSAKSIKLSSGLTMHCCITDLMT
jgi:hypothetical protein